MEVWQSGFQHPTSALRPPAPLSCKKPLSETLGAFCMTVEERALPKQHCCLGRPYHRDPMAGIEEMQTEEIEEDMLMDANRKQRGKTKRREKAESEWR
ncbi:hypothetical protein CesoFtcFv8_008118 [Champsocephalus esox]|uniref:Uncharacterized protein n=1 Tax=Champsocephalus esox TaxID=159716 RepID=A0AAN8CFR5_9TELE|nr:hypothetical protein CesoFtcFv8_008118 [Champsocephalus esox]